MRHSPVFLRFFIMLAGGAGRRSVIATSVMAVIAALGMVLIQGPDPRAARCKGVAVAVIAESPADRDAACAGAERAVTVLDGLGLPVLRPIVVQVVDEITIANGASALGTYDPKALMVKVLARSAHSVGGTDEAILGLPFDDELHASVFAHEVTHAVFHQHEDRIPLSPVAHEYVAYSVQLTTLSKDHRRRILERFAVSPFNNVDEVNGMLFAFDPNGFGIKAYLHFRDAADQHAVLRNLARASRGGTQQWY